MADNCAAVASLKLLSDRAVGTANFLLTLCVWQGHATTKARRQGQDMEMEMEMKMHNKAEGLRIMSEPQTWRVIHTEETMQPTMTGVTKMLAQVSHLFVLCASVFCHSGQYPVSCIVLLLIWTCVLSKGETQRWYVWHSQKRFRQHLIRLSQSDDWVKKHNQSQHKHLEHPSGWQGPTSLLAPYIIESSSEPTADSLLDAYFECTRRLEIYNLLAGV